MVQDVQATGDEAARDAPFWTLFMALPVGAVLFALEDDRWIAFNDAACAQLGYSRDEFARLRLADIDALHSVEELLAARRSMQPGDAPRRFNTRQRARDGTLRSVDVTVHCVELGARRYGYAVWHDVTDRDDSAPRVREREAELARVQRVGRVGGFEIDLRDGFANRRSPEYLQLHGLPPEAAHEPHDAWIARLHPEDRERVDRAFRAAVAGDARDYAAEYRIVDVNGDVRWISALAEIERDADGRALRMVGAHRDVTALKVAEAALAAQAEQLRVSDRRKDEFLAILSHELRNPLAPLRNALTLLERSPGIGERDAGFVAMAVRQVRQLARLVDDLLEVSRISHGKLELQSAPLSLADAVRDAAESVRPAMTARGQHLRVSLPTVPLRVFGDHARLVQVFENLLGNASKYSPPGSDIDVDVRAIPHAAEVVVRDRGAGIPAEALASIFDLFVQVDTAPHRAQGGLGIGLALVERLVRMHGGSVVAASDGPGAGASFTVTLPTLD